MNIKKLFPEKKEIRKSLLDFIDKKGFYIVLILCIGIVGATAIFVTTHNVSSPNTGYDTQKIIPDEMNNPASSVSDKNADQASLNGASVMAQKKDSATKPEPKPTANPKPTSPAATKSPAKAGEQKSAPKADNTSKAVSSSGKAQKFIMPVFGQVSLEYANDKLIYSKTLQEWSTHDGLDLACDKGTTVKAVAEGYVSEVKNDPRWGTTIVIEHPNGLKTVYANLSAGSLVSPNQKISTGDIIGCIGATAVFESADQSHLHFEVLKNNEPVDPANYLPKN